MNYVDQSHIATDLVNQEIMLFNADKNETRNECFLKRIRDLVELKGIRFTLIDGANRCVPLDRIQQLFESD